ncbi:unnamed protein product [Darwinula stevensoni]|uniref:Uncharacterized protein n=1 Tax=Darwinula stevensoni TaxID=69355 RepID=A0A7R9AGM3_9CRUS|nr:unnamed protein product [Darwinula stevensoni]CAG0904513.1 unnamed protein product [Darwinula stevensoni]
MAERDANGRPEPLSPPRPFGKVVFNKRFADVDHGSFRHFGSASNDPSRHHISELETAVARVDAHFASEPPRCRPEPPQCRPEPLSLSPRFESVRVSTFCPIGGIPRDPDSRSEQFQRSMKLFAEVTEADYRRWMLMLLGTLVTVMGLIFLVLLVSLLTRHGSAFQPVPASAPAAAPPAVEEPPRPYSIIPISTNECPPGQMPDFNGKCKPMIG